ncbi:MAG: error-prone DNA polymerase [Gammaproteobacteria bacterium]|nr:error-prone DNA polymerase [Gammaproteobacteria bacterium]
MNARAVPAYAELYCLSNFSFLRGASHPEELVRSAHALGYRALALTDECSLAGVVRAHVAAQEVGLPLVIGTELRLEDGLTLVLLAPDAAAYAELSRLVTRGRRRAEKGSYRLTRADLDVLDHVLVLWMPDAVPAPADAAWLAARFPERAWIGFSRLLDGGDRTRLACFERLGADAGLPLVACGGVHMHERARRPLADVLTAIREGRTLEEAAALVFPNGERHLRPRPHLARLYPPRLLEESVRIAARCRFTLAELRYEYPREIVPAGKTPTAWLRTLTERGMARRWPRGVSAAVRAQIEHELALIAELGYEAFFLTVHDIVAFARSRGILCQGRGSAANSAVCFCLGITEVDPARMQMLFERFLSRERNEPPDIDVDFEHERREEVIQYVYAKYGRHRAALAATVITYKPRSALRDVGKALGFSLEQVDRLAKNVYWWDDRSEIPARLREAGFDPAQPLVRRLVALVVALVGFPRHLSQHVGGFVIADGALEAIVPIENAAMPERTVIQWDKDDLDTLGLLKVDCLCLGMLSALRRACDLHAGQLGRPFTLDQIPPDDRPTYAMIQRADTVGVFQIESRAQMAMLPRLRPACYYDLVIEVAIIRPGPIQGEMVHPYLRRRHGEEDVSYPSEEVRGVLERTLGVPLFQEQVIKLAMVAAGFTPGEADHLRRSMARWKKGGALDPFREKLLTGMRTRGYTEEFAERIFNQIQGFGEYGFPESHAASFALLAYFSSWFKCHHPALFTCALLNSQPLGFYAPSQLVQDARRHGVEVRPVDVRASDWDSTLEPAADGPALRLGLGLVKGFPAAAAARLVAARATQPYTSTADLARRAALDRGAIKLLAEGGALAGLAGDRHQAAWAALGVEAALPVLGPAEVREATPLLRVPREGENIVADYARLGLSTGRHPLALLRRRLARLRCLSAADIAASAHGTAVRTAGLVITRQRPGTATGVVFVTLEDETGSINLIVWSSLVDSQRRELLGARLMGAAGEVQRDGEVVHVVARRLFDYSGLLGRLSTESRDFH